MRSIGVAVMAIALMAAMPERASPSQHDPLVVTAVASDVPVAASVLLPILPSYAVVSSVVEIEHPASPGRVSATPLETSRVTCPISDREANSLGYVQAADMWQCNCYLSTAIDVRAKLSKTRANGGRGYL